MLRTVRRQFAVPMPAWFRARARRRAARFSPISARSPLSPGSLPWLLAFVTKRHGCHVDLHRVLRDAPVAPDGADLCESLLRSGLGMEEVSIDVSRGTLLRGTLIAFLRTHGLPEPGVDPNARLLVPAVIVGLEEGRVTYLVAGSDQPVHASQADAKDLFEETALAVHPVGPRDHDELPSPAAGDTRFGFGWFAREILRHRAIWRDVLVASAVLQVIGLTMPLVAQIIIDKVVVHHTLSTLAVVGAAAVLFLAFGGVLSWVRQYLVLHTGNRIDAVLGHRIVAHMLHLPPRYFEQRPVGTVVARLQGVDVIREFVCSAAITAVLDSPFLLVFIVLMFTYSWELALIALGCVAMVAMLSLLATPALRARVDRQFLAGARTQSFLTEHVSGIATVKALQMEAGLERRYGDILSRYLDASFRTRTLVNTYHVATSTVEQFMQLAILLTGAMLVMRNDGFTIGMLVAFQMFAGRVTQPLLRLAGLWQEFQQASVAVTRIGDLMNAPAEPCSFAATRSRGEGPCGIAFEHVSFRYGDRRSPVLHDFSCEVPGGELVVVSGPSGSGKSTLARLLLGFEHPGSGRIRLGERDTAWLSANELREHFGVVSQETTLFSGSIADNLLAAAPHASMDDVVTACRLAEIHACIEALPDGYSTRLGEQGAGLSGGQRQRIAIARALLRRPRVLIFDEATSHLDVETASAIARTVNALRGRATILFITHSAPPGLRPDRVVRLGTHDGQDRGTTKPGTRGMSGSGPRTENSKEERVS